MLLSENLFRRLSDCCFELQDMVSPSSSSSSYDDNDYDDKNDDAGKDDNEYDDEIDEDEDDYGLRRLRRRPPLGRTDRRAARGPQPADQG